MTCLFEHCWVAQTIDTVHSVDVKHFRPLKVLKHSLQRITRTEYPEFRIVYYGVPNVSKLKKLPVFISVCIYKSTSVFINPCQDLYIYA